jgi:hypothetical protein
MTISEKQVTRYYPECDACGWKGSPSYRREMAQHDFDRHPCGRHYQAHDSTGGFRGILGGYNVYCVCGARYVDYDGSPFHCPRDKGRPDDQGK